MISLKRIGNGRAVELALVNPQLTGDSLTFKTRPVGGISYNFAGVFWKTGDSSSLERLKGANLKGRLTKMQGSRKVSEGDVSFHYGGE